MQADIAGVVANENSLAFCATRGLLAEHAAQMYDADRGSAAWMGVDGRATLSSSLSPPGVNGRARVAVAWTGVLHAPLQWPGNTADQVAAGYACHGDAVLTHLVGDFSFALWEERTRLVLATDAFGLRPLYYAVHPVEHLLAFASATQLLRRLPWVGNALDEATVINLLLDRNWEQGRTPLRNIRLLPAGHCLTWTRGEQQARPALRRHWGQRFAPTGIRSQQELLQSFEQAVCKAVAQRMEVSGGAAHMRDSGAAVLMSGGYDSTAVAGVAAAVRRAAPGSYAPLHTVSATFGNLPCDESARITMARAHNGLPYTTVPALDLALRVSAIERQVRDADFPLFNLQDALLNAEFDAAQAAAAGTILMGLGGDELTTDMGYDRDLLASRGWHRLGSVARAVAPMRGRSTLHMAMRLARAAAPPAVKGGWRRLKAILPSARYDPAYLWLQPEWHDMAKRCAVVTGSEQVDGAQFGSHLQRALWANLQLANVQFGQRVTAQDALRRGFAFGAPFLDRRLFELILGTDAQWLPRTASAAQYKPLITTGLRAYMPSDLTRTYWKVDFGSYNRAQMRTALDAVAQWLFDAGTWQLAPFVAKSTARAAVEAFRNACDRNETDADAHLRRLYSIVGVEAWLRQL